MHDELTGTIDRFLFQSPDNGFSVVVLQVSTTTTAIIKGYFPNTHAGQHINVVGSWTTHPKFGKQFDATSFSTSVPTTHVGLKKYLGSGLIKGIGPKSAEKLVDYFGVTILDIIEKNPEQLYKVPSFGKKKIEMILNSWSQQKEIANVMVFLQEKGVSTAYATKIYKKYGQQSIALVKENPYRLADEIWGIGFKIADAIAQNLGYDTESLKRLKAGIIFAITSEISNGHLYLEVATLKQKTKTLLELEDSLTIDEKIKQALTDLYHDEKIKLITHDNKHLVTLTQYYFSEKGVATKIRSLISRPTPHSFDMDALYKLLSTTQEGEINLNEDQQRGILACLQHKVSIITGGPGTGKTTLVKKLLQLLESQKIQYRLAAPTGRAAKRMFEGTGRSAVTLHRLLEFNFETNSFTHNEQNALKLDFLIVDEASMIDIFLAHALLKALPADAHLILIGDVDQLPSVGAGNFLNDVIASTITTTTRLKHIFRQSQDSLIIINAHRINNGEFPTSFLPDAKRDFVYIKEDEPDQVKQHLESIYATKLHRYGIKAEESIVLVPMNRGIVGTQTINQTLQSILNPGSSKAHINRGDSVFKQGDRVMQIRNNYDKIVFNGDIGIIDTIDTEDRTMSVLFGDRSIEYEFNELEELVLAYAVTIHKSQGSEYAAVIVPLFMQHFTLLQRNLIYTAITRAKRLCIFIGQPRAIAMGIKNNKGITRTTLLQPFLTTDLQCR
jgi:exodeoxyribonuclease V alpha subunit